MVYRITLLLLCTALTLHPKDAVPAQKKQRTVEIQNSIDDTMTTYSHWTGNYTPDFSISINDQTLEKGKSQKVAVQDNQLAIRYHYNFVKGVCTGSKIVTFNIEPKLDKLSVTFSWKNEWRLMIEGATPISIERPS